MIGVSASALALHLDCSRTYIAKREADGVIQRQGDGFPLDQGRVAYLQYLRRERQQSPRAAADADHVKVKTEMSQMRLMEKKRELVRRADVDALIDGIAGVTLTALSSLPARCAPPGDLATRRSIERAVSPTSASRWPTTAASRRWTACTNVSSLACPIPMLVLGEINAIAGKRLADLLR
jgi:hypothetical protein